MAEKIPIEYVRQMFKEDFIFYAPKVSTSTELIKLMGEYMVEKGYVKPSFTDTVILREQNYPTGLTTELLSFAVPHTDACHVIHPAIVVAKLNTPIEFDAMGMEEGKIMAEYVFLLLLKKDGDHVAILQRLLSMCTNPETTAKMRAAKDAQEVYDIIQTYYGSVAS